MPPQRDPNFTSAWLALTRLFLDKGLTVLVCEFVGGDEDYVDDVPDANAAAGDQFEDSKADVTEVKAIDAEAAEENGEEKGDEPIFALGWRCCCALCFSPIHNVFTNMIGDTLTTQQICG